MPLCHTTVVRLQSTAPIHFAEIMPLGFCIQILLRLLLSFGAPISVPLFAILDSAILFRTPSPIISFEYILSSLCLRKSKFYGRRFRKRYTHIFDTVGGESVYWPRKNLICSRPNWIRSSRNLQAIKGDGPNVS